MAILARIEVDGTVSDFIVGPEGHADGGVAWAADRLGGRWLEASIDGSIREAPTGIGGHYCEQHDSFACVMGCDHGDFIRRQRNRNADEWTWFMGREFLCEPGLYVPPQFGDMTAGVNAVVAANPASVLDIGAGIGTLGITIAAETGCSVTLVEPIKRLSELSAANADMHNINATCIVGEISAVAGEFDAIITDVPYIPSAIAADFPHRYAADGGEDGLQVLREIFASSARVLKSNGLLVTRSVALPIVDNAHWSIVSNNGEELVIRKAA